jgi:hypothetical protein
MITDDEWEVIASILENGYPGSPWTQTASRAYRVLLSDYSTEQIIAALKVYNRVSGPGFRPSAKDIVQTIVKPVKRLSWPEIELWLVGDGTNRGVISGSWTQEQIVGAAAQVDPVLASYVAARGVAGLAMIPFDDPEWGGKHRRDLQKDYERFCEGADERVARGLELPAAARVAGALERAKVGELTGGREQAALGAGEAVSHGD